MPTPILTLRSFAVAVLAGACSALAQTAAPAPAAATEAAPIQLE